MLKHIAVCFTINFASVPVPLDPSDEQATPTKFYFLYLRKIWDYIEARSACNVIAVSQMKLEERSNTESRRSRLKQVVMVVCDKISGIDFQWEISHRLLPEDNLNYFKNTYINFRP